MKRGIIWIVLTCLMVTSLVLASCATETTASTSAPTSTTTKTTTTTTTTTTKTITTPSTTATTVATGNWWDSLGTPQYGGTMTLRLNNDISTWDVYNSPGVTCITAAYIEKTIGDDWTLDPTVYNYQLSWRPPDFVKGNIAQSWEFKDQSTVIMHLRQGIYWQNIAPANGRAFTADDVVYHYDRLFGLGGGFTTPSPYYSGSNWLQAISVTATDKYTVVFKWNMSNPEFILETMESLGDDNAIECPDAVKLWGNLNDWHHAIGTGPFILQDFVSGSSATLTKNPAYWAHDERYPQNQLPYVDTLKFLKIPDDATALAAMRTGKIDIMNQMSSTQAQDIKKTNPDILQISTVGSYSMCLLPRDDKAPFNNVNVREALQMAIDLPTIAKTYYNGSADPSPSSLTSNYLTGWCIPYSQWSQDLKDQYAYNPTMAKQLLTNAGYPNGFNTDIVANNSWDLNLLQIIKSYYTAIGVNMEIRTLNPASWVSFVRQNHSNDALAYGNMLLGLSFEPVGQIQMFSTGFFGDTVMVSDKKIDAWVGTAINATTVDGMKQVLIDENTYIAQQHYAISLPTVNQYAFCQPWLKGYNGQSQSVTAEANAPFLCYFYASRFWIDQSMEK